MIDASTEKHSHIDGGASSFSRSNRQPMRWWESLYFKFSCIQVILLIFIVGATIIILLTVARSLLLEKGYDLAEETGARMVSELNVQVMLVESISTALANIAESLDKDVGTFKKIIPHLIDYDGGARFITGGGIWPEPNEFTSGVVRRSFFWGRDQAGKLTYYDNYNDPTGAGYHNEEWYVPAVLFPSGLRFWSRSYMDPYSYQPMVTCSVPMISDGRVVGVSTVDVNLERLVVFFEKTAKVLDGYIFAMDRNNKLLSYPRPEMAKKYSVDEKGNRTEDYLYIYDIAKTNSSYGKLAKELVELDEQLIAVAGSSPLFTEDLVKEIHGKSYNINPEEARLIAAVMVMDKLADGNNAIDVKRMFLEDDPLLNEPVMVMIYRVPGTFWKIVVVTPKARFYVAADAATRKVATYVVILELGVLLIMFIVLRRLFIMPIRIMARDVRRMADNKKLSGERLNESSPHELGLLAFEFNFRTDSLIEALDRADSTKAELKKKMAELARLNLIIETTSDLVAMSNPNSGLIYMNSAGRALVGWDNDVVIEEMRIADIHPGWAYEIIWEESIPLSLRNGIWTGETAVVNRDGEEITVSQVIMVHRSIDGEVEFFSTIMRDMTEQKRSDVERSRLRNLLSNIIDSMPSVLVGVDANGEVTQWNKKAAQITGIAADIAQGKKLSDVFPQMASEMKKIAESIRTREITRDQKRPRQLGSETCYEDVTIYPLIGNDMEGAVIRVDDVTEQVRMEEMVVQSEKMVSVGCLAAGMAHEINNPLAGMMQNADVISNRLTNLAMPANRRVAEQVGISMEGILAFMEKRSILHMIAAMKESGRRVAEIVENMLNFARKSNVQVSFHDLSDLLDRTLDLAATDYDLKKQYDFKTIEIVKEYEENLPPVSCEGGNIQQVLLNILRNCAYAMLAGSENGKKPRFILRLAYEKETDQVRIEIEDNGLGMVEATRKRVFEPFFTTKSEGTGMGLGLSISYFIITENHGGAMRVESEPEKGAIFIIHLPVERKSLKLHL